jgi:hypothetical protein
VKEGFARSSSTKERRCLEHFQKAKGEAIEEIIQAQGVCLRSCSSSYKIRRKGEKLPRVQEKLAKKLGTLEILKLSKVVGELHRFL